MEKVLYFAYGSNLDADVRRERRLPGSPVGTAWLPDHRLSFHKPSRRWGAVATVEPCPGRGVWGLLFEVPRGRSPRLIESEGGFVRVDVDVHTDGGMARARCHVGNRRLRSPVAPMLEHLRVVYQGLRQHGAPDAYVERVLRAGLRDLPARTADAGDAAIVRAALDALTGGLGVEVPGPDCGTRDLELLCHSLAHAQRGPSLAHAGGWAFGDGEDAVVESTALVLALLVAYRRQPITELSPIPRLDERIRDGMECLAALRFAGPHLDKLHRASRVVRILARGGIPAWLAGHPGFAPALHDELAELCQELVDIRAGSPVFGAWGVPAREVVDAAIEALAPLVAQPPP